MAVAVGFLASRVSAAIGRDLRRETFSSVIGFSNAEIENFSTASLITRTTNDIQQVQFVCVILLRMVAYAPILGIGGVLHGVGQQLRPVLDRGAGRGHPAVAHHFPDERWPCPNSR